MRHLLWFSLLVLWSCGDGERAPKPPPVEGGWVEDTAGLWTLARPDASGELAGIGYASGWEAAPDQTGVLLNRAAQVQPGLNLYCSGHGPEAFLIDAEGQVLHTWRRPYADLAGAPPLDGEHQRCWRRVRLLPGGDLLVMHAGRALVRLDRDSNPLWVFGERVHHDTDLDQEGGIWTLTREERLLPRINSERAVIDDDVVHLSPEGQVLGRWSVAKALLASRWASLVLAAGKREGELMHVNSIRLLRGVFRSRDPAFAAGNLLLCARDLDLLMVLDPARNQIVWARQSPADGGWRMPHDPRELESGYVLLFDNLGASAPEHGLASRLLELDPRTGRIEWQWRADPPSSFFSRFCGSAARLANGNTLVTETGAGRAFEMTSAGELVWVFQSPHRAGKRDELVAALFEVSRVPRAEVSDWLGR